MGPERVTLRIHRRTEPPPEDDNGRATGEPLATNATTHSTGEPAGGSGGGCSYASGSAVNLPRSSVLQLALLRGVRTLSNWRSSQANGSAAPNSNNNNNNNLVKLTAVEQRQASRIAGACRTQFNLTPSKTIAQQQQPQINGQSSADRQQRTPAASEAIAQPPPPPPPLHFTGRARRASSIVRREATIEEEVDNNNAALPQIRIDDRGLELGEAEAEPEVSKGRRVSAPTLDCCVVRPHRHHHHHHHHNHRHHHHHRHRHHRNHCNHHHHHNHHNHNHRLKLEPEIVDTPSQVVVATPVGEAELDELESVSSVQISIQDFGQEQARPGRSQSVDLVAATSSGVFEGEVAARSQSQRGGGVGGEALPMLVVSWNGPNETTTTTTAATTLEPNNHAQADEQHRLAGSGLSLVTSLVPTQVRKQSMMLLSSLSTRSSQTLRRLSMVAAHPMDSLSGRLKSRTGSRHQDGDSMASGWSSDAVGAKSSDDDDPEALREPLRRGEQAGDEAEVGDRKLEKKLLKKRRRKQMKRKRVAKELARKLSKKSTNEVRNNSLASGSCASSPMAQLPSSPKKTLDDYLMAVAGIDNSSSSSGASGDEDEDDDDDLDDNDNDDDDTGSGSSNDEDLEAGPSKGGMKLALLLKREHLLIPSITIMPSSDEQSNRSPGSPASSDFRGAGEPPPEVTQSHSDDTSANDKQLDCSATAATATCGQSSSARTSIISFRSFTADALMSGGSRVGVGGGVISKRSSLEDVKVKVKRTDRLPPSAGLHRQGGLYESHTSQRASSAEALEADTPMVAACPAPASPDLFKLERPAVGRPSESAQQQLLKRATPGGGALSEGGGSAATRTRRGAKRTSRWHAKRLRAETKAAKTVAIIVGGFIFCWLPFFTAYLTRALLCPTPDCVPQTWLSLFIWLGYLNSAINPVIYGLFSADFRHAFRNIVCRCSLRAPSPRAQQRANNRTTNQADDTATVSFLVDSIIKSIL